ncbi:23192_t:CDS:2, partial [Dentiscutata erythropus]
CEHIEWLNSAIINNQIIQYDYKIFNNIIPIGRGSSGDVSSAISPEFKDKVALKSIKINPSYTIELLINELKQHIHVGSHNNILNFYGITKNEPNEFILVLEYANNGTLKEYLCENFDVLNWDNKLHIATQLADAIKFLHSHDIIHRDLHSENVLIHNKIVKLGDFGNSKFIADPSIQLTKAIGSLCYSDPEFLKKKPVHGTPKDYAFIYEGKVVFNLENININNVISVDENELDEDIDNSKLITTNLDIIQKLISEIDEDSDAYRSLSEALSSASIAETLSSKSNIEALNSTSNIDKNLNSTSNISEISNSTSNISEISNSVLNIEELEMYE